MKVEGETAEGVEVGGERVVVVYRTSVPLASLLHSRKFWIAVVGVMQAVILNYVDVPPEVWQSVMVLAGVLIGAIAYEDAAYMSGVGSATGGVVVTEREAGAVVGDGGDGGDGG